MSLTKFEKDMDVVQKLDDEPNDVGGLTSAALKAKFDEGGKAVKEYLNDVLLPALDAYIARTDNPHAVTKAQVGLGDVDNTADADKPVSTAQQAAIALKADIAAVLTKTNTSAFTPSASYHPATKKYVDDMTASVVLGQIPDGTVTEAKMTDDVKEKLNGPRTPTAHAATHHTGGSDPLTPADFGCLAPRLTVTAPTGSTVTASRGSTTLTATESSGTWVFNLTDYGTWTVSATLGVHSASGTITVDTVKEYSLELSYVKVYGVSWDGTATTAWSRTDDAADFVDPVPYVAGATTYGSPFDNLQPWAGMVRTTDATAGELVAIPKYWFKWTKSGNSMKLQIADKATAGFSVSPAHADRGDGVGERDVVYVGRYHCNSAYKSVTGAAPQANITRASARTSIHNLGSNIWQYDFAMYWTIMMLYLVEFADWNSQAKIGYGCGNNSAAQAVGASDSMPYHTGTMQSSRTTYGAGCQYRYIEGLWDNVYDWCDGIYFSGSNVYCIKNPASFSDTANGTNIGTRPTSSNYISAWSIPTASGFEYALYPSAVAGSESTYICDYCYYDSGGVVLCCGGYYGQGQNRGLFYLVGSGTASISDANIGCRLQKLP